MYMAFGSADHHASVITHRDFVQCSVIMCGVVLRIKIVCVKNMCVVHIIMVKWICFLD